MFFKKKKPADSRIYSPVNGKAIPLEKVQDPVFSSRAMGEGAAFVYDEDTVYSPCDGVVAVVPESLHAVGLKADNGMEILIHVGMDTVELNGRGFRSLVKQGERVHVHDPILKIDRSFMAGHGIDLTTPMIVTNGLPITVRIVEGPATIEDEIFELKK